VLRFLVAKESGLSGSILVDGRVFCADAYYYAQKHGRRDTGERCLAAIAAFADGEVRSAGRDMPEVFGRDGRQINVAALLPYAETWRDAIANFVREMRATAHG